jgi:hypothetical protein
LLKREEAEAVAVREDKAGAQGNAQRNRAKPAVLELWVVPPSLTLPGSAAAAAGGSSRQQQQQQQPDMCQEHNHLQAHEMQRLRASGDPPMAKPKETTKSKGTGTGT